MKKLIVAGAVAALTTSMASVAMADDGARSAGPTVQAPAAGPSPQQVSSGYVVVGRQALTPALRARVAVVAQKRDAAGRDVAILDLKGQSISSLLPVLPSRQKGTGGFTGFTTLAEAEASVAAPVGTDRAMLAADYSIDQQAVVTPMLSQVNHQNIYATINKLSTAWANRYTTTQNARNAAAWIMSQEKMYAGSRTDTTTEYYTGCTDCGGAPLVVHTIKGTDLANEYVVIGGHYDSIVSGVSTFTEYTKAPGADDNASSQGTMLEAIRVLHANNLKPRRTLVFMSFPAEEIGLRGSKAAAAWYKGMGRNVVGMLNFDMTNYKSSTEYYDFSYVSDNTSSAQNTYVKNLIATYLPTMRVKAMQCGYACTDHAPFNAQGYAATSLAEPTLIPTYHTTNDSLAYVGNTAQPSEKFAKLAVAYAVEMGGVTPSGTTTTESSSTTDQGATPLGNNVPLSVSGATGSEKLYSIDVPAGSSNLVVSTSGGTGDVDLYVRRGAAPTSSTWDCRPYQTGNNETCTVAPPAADRYYVLLRAYSSYSGVTLKASYTGGPGDSSSSTSSSSSPTPGVTALNNGQTVAVSGGTGSDVYYSVTVPVGSPGLTVRTQGGTGDLDLYVQRGAKPTDTSYLCRPYLTGNNETCTLDNPAGGTYYIRLKGYAAYSGATLQATYAIPGSTGPTTSAAVQPLLGGVPVTVSGAAGSEQLYALALPQGDYGVTVTISGGTGDVDLSTRLGSAPSATTYDCRPYQTGNEETCSATVQGNQTYYVRLSGYTAYSGVTLKATYSPVISDTNSPTSAG